MLTITINELKLCLILVKAIFLTTNERYVRNVYLFDVIYYLHLLLFILRIRIFLHKTCSDNFLCIERKVHFSISSFVYVENFGFLMRIDYLSIRKETLYFQMKRFLYFMSKLVQFETQAKQ